MYKTGRPRTIPRNHPSNCICLGCSRLQWKRAKILAIDLYSLPKKLHICSIKRHIKGSWKDGGRCLECRRLYKESIMRADKALVKI